MPRREAGYSTDLIGSKACEIVRNHCFEEQPLFLYVPFNAPHTPRQAKEADVAEYSHIEDGRRRIHAAMVTSMDHQIGAVLDALIERGVAGDTLVIFASDNGGYAETASNAPLRGHKGTLYEGGIRVPACMCWPGQLHPGYVVAEKIYIIDLLPTLVGLAQGNFATGQPLDGIDVWHAIRDAEQLPPRDIVHNVLAASGRGAIRRGEWKLIVQIEGVMGEGILLEHAGLVAQLYNIVVSVFPTTQGPICDCCLLDHFVRKGLPHGNEVGDSGPYSQPPPTGWEPPPDWSNLPE